jgi:hypothetical protein
MREGERRRLRPSIDHGSAEVGEEIANELPATATDVWAELVDAVLRSLARSDR